MGVLFPRMQTHTSVYDYVEKYCTDSLPEFGMIKTFIMLLAHGPGRYLVTFSILNTITT